MTRGQNHLLMGYNMIGRQGNVNMILVIDVEIDVLDHYTTKQLKKVR